MSSTSTSKSVVPVLEPGKRRNLGRLSAEAKAEITEYYKANGFNATAKRYHINSRFLRDIRAIASRANGDGTERHTPRQAYLLAKKLKDAVSEQLRSGVELDDVLIYATLLTRQLLE